MPRSIRVEYVGAMYHVMNRGNARGEIFRDEKDYDYFKRWMGKVCGKARWKVHAWTLMPNHYHLLIEIRAKSLIRGMQLLNSEYTRYFNRRWKLCGPLFQGRYKATLVEGKAGYLLTAADYIHLNFARSYISKTMEELVANPETSVGCYVRGKFPDWMEWKKVMGSIGVKDLNAKGRQKFYKHLKAKWGDDLQEDEQWKKFRRSWCWGGEKMMEKFHRLMSGKRGESEGTEVWQRGTLQESEEAKAKRLLEKWKAKKGDLNQLPIKQKWRIAYEIREESFVKVDWLAQELGIKSKRSLITGMSLIRKGKL
jgi:putative transposase